MTNVLKPLEEVDVYEDFDMETDDGIYPYVQEGDFDDIAIPASVIYDVMVKHGNFFDGYQSSCAWYRLQEILVEAILENRKS